MTDKPTPFGKYVLLERINVGGMAEVFKAKAFGVEGFERLVAVKRILPAIAEDTDFITMFVDEAKIAVQLTHANIAQIFDLGKVSDSYFIALEYVHGKDLRAIFDRTRKRGETVPIPMCCYTMMKACEGLDYAHNKRDPSGRELKLVHRDVSPQNFIISYDGEVKVIDFGIATAAGKATTTQTGMLKGKFGYMSPEQVRGVPIDRRSDLFALGIVLYELLTGERLFIGESDFATLEKIKSAEIIPPTTYNARIPEELERIVMKVLAKETEERYQTAMDLHDDLQSFMYTSGNFFARKDLSLYMRELFAEEITREKAREDEFRTFDREFEDSGEMPTPAVSLTGLIAAQAAVGKSRLGTDAVTPPTPPPAARPLRPSTAPGAGPVSSSAAAMWQQAKTDVDSAPSVVMDWDDDDMSTEIYDKPGQLRLPPTMPNPGPAATPGTLPFSDGSEATTAAGGEAVVAAPDPAPAAKPRASAPPPPPRSSAPPPPPRPSAAPVAAASGIDNARSSAGAPSPGSRPPPPRTLRDSAPPPFASPQVESIPDEPTHELVPIVPAAVPAAAVPAAAAPSAPPPQTTAVAQLPMQPFVPGVLPVHASDAGATVREPNRWSAERSLIVGLLALGAVLLSLIGLVVWLLAPKHGALAFETTPADVGVQIDGKPLSLEHSPFRISEISEGSHELVIESDGFERVARTFHIQRKQLTDLGKIELRSTDGRGSVGSTTKTGFALRTEPAGANIRVDGRDLDVVTPVEITDLSPGTHFIEVRHEGNYAPYRTQISVNEGQVLALPELVLEQDRVNVTFESDPEGAEVTLVSSELPEPRTIGTTPVRRSVQISFGTWTVQMKAAGYEPWVEALVVPSGKDEVIVHARLHRTPGAIQPETAPAPEAVSSPRDETPRPSADARPVTPRPQARQETPPVRRESPEPKPEPEPVARETAPKAESDATGTLQVNTVPWSQVFVDGRLIGNTPQRSIALRTGEHRVTFVNPDFDVKKTITVTIKAGETLKRVENLSP